MLYYEEAHFGHGGHYQSIRPLNGQVVETRPPNEQVIEQVVETRPPNEQVVEQVVGQVIEQVFEQSNEQFSSEPQVILSNDIRL